MRPSSFKASPNSLSSGCFAGSKADSSIRLGVALLIEIYVNHRIPDQRSGDDTREKYSYLYLFREEMRRTIVQTEGICTSVLCLKLQRECLRFALFFFRFGDGFCLDGVLEFFLLAYIVKQSQMKEQCPKDPEANVHQLTFCIPVDHRSPTVLAYRWSNAQTPPPYEWVTSNQCPHKSKLFAAQVIESSNFPWWMCWDCSTWFHRLISNDFKSRDNELLKKKTDKDSECYSLLLFAEILWNICHVSIWKVVASQVGSQPQQQKRAAATAAPCWWWCPHHRAHSAVYVYCCAL